MRGCSSVATAAILGTLWLASSGRCEEIHLEIEGLPEAATVSAFVAGQEGVAAVPDGGVWKLAGLTPGTYNVEIRAGGLHIIGVDLRLSDADGNPVETAPAGETVETTIREFFEHTKDFFDERRMPLVAGAGDRAVALVENVRRGDTTTYGAGRGNVFFRLDLWDFEKSFGSWQKTGSRVFLRRMLAAGEFESAHRLYSRELGGIDLAPDQVRKITYTFPSDENTDQEERK